MWRFCYPICLILLCISIACVGSAFGGALDCNNAIELINGAPYTNSTSIGASNVAGYSCIGWNEPGNEVVHYIEITADSSLFVNLQFTNPSADLDIFLLSECDEQSCLRFGDNFLFYSSASPATYYIVVDSFKTVITDYTVTAYIYQHTPTPTGTPGTALDCSEPIAMICGVPYNGSTIEAPSQVHGYNCITYPQGGPEVVHSVNIYNQASLTARLSNVTMFENLDVFILDACNENACLAFGDGTAEVLNAPPGLYYIIVDGRNDALGEYTLTLSCGSQPTPTYTPFYSPSPTGTPPPSATPTYPATATPTSTPDHQPPNAPRNLTIEVFKPGMVLEWYDNPEEDLDGYNIYRAQDNYQDLNVIYWRHKVSHFEDYTVRLDTRYYYAVSAIDIWGNESELSNIVSGMIDGTPPQAPTGLQAYYQNKAIYVSWNPNQEDDLLGYYLYRSFEDGGAFSKVTGMLPNPSYRDTSFLPDSIYYYRVTALDFNENESDPSEVVSVITDMAAPRIYIAGYWDTYIGSAVGGELKMYAYVVEPPQVHPVGPIRTEIYYQGAPTGVLLRDDGTQGDGAEGDGVYTLRTYVPPGAPGGQIELEIVSIDGNGNHSDPWPALTIH